MILVPVEIEQYFRDRQECVLYDDNLERLLDYYLDHEDERVAIAKAAQERVSAPVRDCRHCPLLSRRRTRSGDFRSLKAK